MTFEEAYELLAARSTFLVQTECGDAEVWETNGSLLTIVDFPDKTFATKRRQDNPCEYDRLRKEVLAGK